MRDWRGLFLLLLLSACARAAAEAPELVDAGAVDAGPPDPMIALRALYASRFDPTSLDHALTQLDTMAGAEAELLAAQGHLFRARAFRRGRSPTEKASALSDLEHARVLALHVWDAAQPGAAAQLGEASLPTFLVSTPITAAPALRVLARTDWELARHRDPVGAVGLRRECRALAARAVELDPEAELGAARTLWAMTLAVLPRLAGGDFAQAQLEFHQAATTAPESIESRVEEAARYAVKAHDRPLFRALLRSALLLDANQPAALAPEQHVAREHALWLAHHERELFGR